MGSWAHGAGAGWSTRPTWRALGASPLVDLRPAIRRPLPISMCGMEPATRALACLRLVVSFRATLARFEHPRAGVIAASEDEGDVGVDLAVVE